MDECMLLSGYDPNGAFLSHYYQETRGVRSIGSAALNLCFLAAGSADAVWEFDTYPWDVAAGVVIAREAGATLTNTNGDRYDPIAAHETRNELVGSNGPVHEDLSVISTTNRNCKLRNRPAQTDVPRHGIPDCAAAILPVSDLTLDA